eukprot:3417478-Prymnesium_polylepis.1
MNRTCTNHNPQSSRYAPRTNSYLIHSRFTVQKQRKPRTQSTPATLSHSRAHASVRRLASLTIYYYVGSLP